MDLTIRPWCEADQSIVTAMIQDCLTDTYAEGAELAPTARNAAALWELGLSWSLRGEPTLVACNGQPVAFTLWGEFPNVAGLDTRTKTCSGIATYVAPTYRRTGVSKVLRAQALAMAKERGMTVRGVAYSEAGLRSVLTLGFQQVGIMVESV